MAMGLPGMGEVLASIDMIKKQRQEKKEDNKNRTQTENPYDILFKDVRVSFITKLVKILDAFLGPQIVKASLFKSLFQVVTIGN